MKPCPKNLKPLTSLALGDLEPGRARAFRHHLETCAGCRRYLEEMSGLTRVLDRDAASTREVEVHGSFHSALLRRLEGQGTQSLRGCAQSLWEGWLGRRRSAWSVALLMLSALLVYKWHSRPVAPPQPLARNTPANVSPASIIPADDLPEPTEANYMAAANRSLDELSNLLDREGRHSAASGSEPVYTVFLIPPEDLR